MKSFNLVKVLSLAVLLGGLAKVSNLNNLKSSSKLFLESTQATDLFEEAGKSYKLREPRRQNASTDLLASAVKVQISDVDEHGNRAIRYVAAISALDIDATFTRTIYNEDGTVSAETTIMAVDYAYDALIADGELVLPSSFGEEYKYFIAYTLGNVPESHWYNRIDVSVNVNEEVSERKANIEGVIQGYVQDSNLVYTERPGYVGQYQVAAASTDITSANISGYHVVYEDIVATRGKVTAIAKEGFAGCNNLETLAIPNTISYFDEMCFENVTYIDDVQYNASSASMHTSATMPNVGTLKFGEEVKKLPNGMFLNNSIGQIEYVGTKEEWDSVNKGENNFSLKEVKCKDSAIYKVIFHFDGATLNGNENTYSYETYEGKTLVNPGKPEKEGQSFDGWYLDENFETKFATVPASFPEGTEEVHVYAKFVTEEGGMDAEHPLPLNMGLNAEATTSTAMPHVYYSFTADKNDIYIIKDVCTSSTKFTTSGVWLYSDDMTLLTSDTSSGQFEISWQLEAGKTYIIKAGHYSANPSTFGTIQIEVSTVDGDQISEAKVINFNEDVAGTYLGSSKPFYFEYTPDGTSAKPSSVRIKNTNTTNGIIYINLLDKVTGEQLDTAKFAKYTSSTAQYKDFSLEAGVSYVFEIYTPTKNKQFAFKLIDAPQGGTSVNPYVYTLENGQVSIPYSTLNNCYEDSNVSKKYYDAYYKFVPTQSFNGKLSIGNDMSTSTSKKNAKSFVEVYKDGEKIYTAGTISEPVQNPSTDIDFIAGSVYIINIKSIGSSLVKPYSTTFNISVNSTVTPEQGETPEQTTGDSLENPFIIEDSLTVPTSISLTLETGQTKYFSVNITKDFTDLIVDSGYEVKLYSAKLALLSDASSDANKVLNYNAFGEGTYIIEIYSQRGGTTTLKLQDNYDIYNEN